MKKAFVIGHPISHSKSPVIHNYWIKKIGLDATYSAISVEPSNIPDFVNDLRAGKYIGGNVTLPHKVLIAKFCDQLTGSARLIGATNTLYFGPSEQLKPTLIGTNTDMYGFLANLDTQSTGWDENLRTAIILGAGGASRAIIAALIQRQCRKIIILNRTLKNAVALVTQFGRNQNTSTLHADIIENFAEHAKYADILINTTSIGMNNSYFPNFTLQNLPDTSLVTDIVYTPLVTPLLNEAEARGLKVVTGLGMLLHQAVPGFEKWFGIRPEVDKDLTDIVVSNLNAQK